jgi:hypothetical protein
MRNAVSALVLAAAVSLGTQARAAPDECSIRDSALCLANKNCHWDGTKPGDLRVGRHARLQVDRRDQEMRI